MAKIFISTFPFSRYDERPLELLKHCGHDFILNESGGRLTAQQIVDLGKDADAIIAGTEDISKLVESSDKLKIIARVGIGVDSVPLPLCKEKNIQVVYTPDAVTTAVGELTLGFMISLTRRIAFADKEVRKGNWQRFQGKSLEESIIGLIGFGRIGKKVAELLLPFKPKKILVNDVVDPDLMPFKKLEITIESVSKKEIYKNSDIISLHIPKTHESMGMIDTSVFEVMKKNAFIINTSRGGIINEDDLEKALRTNQIAGAGLDVFDIEPYSGSLKELENLILTQHMGSCSYQARYQMEYLCLEDVLRFLDGKDVASPVPEEEYIKQQEENAK